MITSQIIMDRMVGALCVALILTVIFAVAAYRLAQLEEQEKKHRDSLPKRGPFRRGYDD